MVGAEQRFESLERIPGILHTFILRHSKIPVKVSKEEVLERLSPYFEAKISGMGFSTCSVTTTEQIHGGQVEVVNESKGFKNPIAGVDGLITTQKSLLLGIFVADCCAVFIADRKARAVSLLHSGKRGSELGIVRQAIRRMATEGVPAEDLTVQLSPCIRPPAYEVDFASRIRKDCEEEGVPRECIHDDLCCNSKDLSRYYSYRLERGKTGRMLALIGLTDEEPK